MFLTLIIVELVVLLVLVVFTAAILLQRRRVHDVVPAPEGTANPSLYFKIMNDTARLAGFQSGGWFRPKSGADQFPIALWLSPDGKTILWISAGRYLGFLRYRRSLLMSKVSDEKFIITADDFVMGDLVGLREVEIVKNADLAELTRRHSQRLALMMRPEPKTFSSGSLLWEMEDMMQRYVDKLAACGLGKYLGPDRDEWRFTGRGAWFFWRRAASVVFRSSAGGRRKPGT